MVVKNYRCSSQNQSKRTPTTLLHKQKSGWSPQVVACNKLLITLQFGSDYGNSYRIAFKQRQIESWPSFGWFIDPDMLQ